MPLESVSVLLPIRNGINYLPKIRSQLELNCSLDDEFIIISDGSNDGSNEFLKSWAREDSRLNVIIQENRGLVATLNLGLMEAKNDWVARFDVDDDYSPNRISLQKRAIQPKTVAIFSDYSFQSFQGHDLGVSPGAIFSEAVCLSLISGNRTPHPVVLMNRKIALKVGGYIAKDFPAEDLSLWMRMSEEGALVTVPETLLNYRLSRNSITARNRKLSVAKRHELVVNFSKTIDFESKMNLRKTLDEQYRDFSFGSLRHTLFLMDLHRLGIIQNRNSSDLKELRYEFIKSLVHSREKATLGLGLLKKIERSIYRLI